MTHESSFKTRQSIERYAQSAYNDLVYSIDFLNKKSNKEELLEIIKTIYGTKRSAYDIQYNLAKVLTKLKDRFEETFAFASIPTYYQDIQSNIQYKEVYALIYKDFNNVIYLFKPFFEEEADELDNRGTVILHELAHMIGLDSEKELNDIKSAESLRNFILLITKKVSKEALLESIKNAPPKLKLATSVLAYSPDQPRDPKGTPTGGQWSSDNSKSSNQNGESEDKNNPNSGKGKGSRKSPPKSNHKPILVSDEVLSELVKTDKVENLEEFYKKLKFEQNGDSKFLNALKNPIDTLSILLGNKKSEAITTACKLYPKFTIVDGEGDAFRHAFLSYRLSELIGTEEAKKFTDAHERIENNKEPSKLMDLVNNQIGINLYNKYKTKGLDKAIKIIQKAQKEGLLRNKPYQIN